MAGTANVFRLLQDVGKAACRCPAHSQAFRLNQPRTTPKHVCSGSTESASQPEYAFEMACSNIRYGKGVTQEVGMDFQNLGAKKVCVMTDKQIMSLPIMTAVEESLHRHHVNYDVFQNVRVEPTDVSFKEAIAFAKAGNFDAFLAVGGGSVMDTCKAANLYASNPDADFLDYVNAPVGKGLPVRGEVKPLLAVPTTAGTGSETTGVAIFDYMPLKAKTGIGSRAIRPLLGIVDPLHVMHMPNRVATYSGFDVLCHALESFTAIPYDERTPRPSNPIERPAYQGSNPISDIWSLQAMSVIKKYFIRSVNDPEDFEARSAMHLASVFAGVGFGNAGVHLCHGMSYPIAGMVKKFQADEYSADHPIVPHGLSVVVTSPAVFQFTAPMCPERHLQAAEALGADITNRKKEDAGKVVADVMRQYMYDLKVDDGLLALGYTKDDIPDLVKGTLPQKRVTKLAPREQTEEDLANMFEQSMKVY
ncbi:hydroxyacid-oxoacid transhydrogenase, mitochondrial-like [Asterias rubens]|uniref:hydroxyacid-oxoacid transhydrogenase, mitochondrial-like n=1 Tax=Asterias rubens TaxID=7604 RepID=UPI00145577FD|nr:hydroxyacid-oxoacid transhydrogenase, mitochondrial-like [Asterias rubens]